MNFARPVFTGDVFSVTDQVEDDPNPAYIAILQHPCALRVNGVDLTPSLLVARVQPHQLVPWTGWTKGFKLMPLPELTSGSENEHYAVKFTEIMVVDSKSLERENRVACLSQSGVNFLMQRWVYHNSRAFVATWKYHEVTVEQFEEAELIEEWCDDRVTDSRTVEEATAECHDWFRSDSGANGTWQELLANSQTRSAVRKGMRDRLRQLESAEQ